MAAFHSSMFVGNNVVTFSCKVPRLARFLQPVISVTRRSSTFSTPSAYDEEFVPLSLTGKGPKQERKKKEKSKLIEVMPPRYTRMPEDQDWTSVWPTARSFHPAVVPFPVWQGYVEKGAPPGKFANAELMKIPNFLHLTPPAIEKHCEALKKFCTPWPEALDTDEKCDKHFPIEMITSDYCHSGPSLRDPRSRIVTLKFKLSSLNFDYHAKDKFIRLVGDRYDKKTDMVTIVTDRCPLRKQNQDYAMYLLTALYYESWKYEEWESEKTEADMEKYFWNGSRSQSSVIDLVTKLKSLPKETVSSVSYLDSLSENPSKEDIVNVNVIQEYGKAVSDLHNEGENEYTITRYRESVCKVLGIEDISPSVCNDAASEVMKE